MKYLMKIKFIIIVFFNLFLGNKAFANDDIVADLSNDKVEISTTFSGAKILLFGAYNGKNGDDIIVKVKGPRGNIKVQKKSRKFGLWAVSDNVIFSNVPKYYYIASNRKISEIASENEIILREFDFKYLKLGKVNKNLDEKELQTWKLALSRNMKREGFWKIEEKSILLNRNTLFRKTLSLPSNVTTGVFNVEILHYREGLLISQEISNINVTKSGVGANIYNIAQEFSALYGILAVIVAVFFGWFANFVFRRI